MFSQTHPLYLSSLCLPLLTFPCFLLLHEILGGIRHLTLIVDYNMIPRRFRKKWEEMHPLLILLQNQPLKDRKLEMTGLGSLAKGQEQFSSTDVGMEGSKEELNNESEGAGSLRLRIGGRWGVVYAFLEIVCKTSLILMSEGRKTEM